MASVTKLRVDLVSIAPVNGCLRCSAEEVGGICSEGDGGDGTHDLSLRLNEHILHTNLSNGTITSSNKDIAVSKNVDGVDALREESLNGTEALEKGTVE